MFTVGKVWCFLLRTGMDYKKSIRKTYTVADISGETGGKGEAAAKNLQIERLLLTRYENCAGKWRGCWFKGLPAGAR